LDGECKWMWVADQMNISHSFGRRLLIHYFDQMEFGISAIWQCIYPKDPLLKIGIKPYKPDEFVSSMHSYLRTIRKEKGCLDFSVYRDFEKENMFIVVGEWKTLQAMEKHFQTQEFELLLGAARVLGETFARNIAEVLKTGSIELARKQIAPNQSRRANDV